MGLLTCSARKEERDPRRDGVKSSDEGSKSRDRSPISSQKNGFLRASHSPKTTTELEKLQSLTSTERNALPNPSMLFSPFWVKGSSLFSFLGVWGKPRRRHAGRRGSPESRQAYGPRDADQGDLV